MSPLKKKENTISLVNKLLFFCVLLSGNYLGFRPYFVIIVVSFCWSILQAKKISSDVFFSVFFLTVIAAIGFFSGIFAHHKLYDFFKDFIYFFRAILLFLSGYFLIQNTPDKKFFVKGIVYLSVATALIHIFISFSVIIESRAFNINKIRMYAGLGNHAESLAFVLLLIKEKTSILFLDIKPKVKKILLTIIAISVFLFFSRTDVGIIILMVLAIKGYLNFSPKFFFYIFVFILTSFTFYAVLENLNPSRDSKGIEFFVFKIRNSVDEIFNSKINTHNDAELWNRWRAYEAKCAIDQTIDKGPATILFGNGFGGLVDIHRVVNLGGTEMRYIPTLHNGFAYIFFKTGFVGLALFLLFFFIELLKNQQNLGDKNLKYFFTALIMSILIMTLVIGGIYGGASLFLFFLGCIYGLKNTE